MPTIVEKILSRASGGRQVRAGDYLTCDVDLAMVHDSSGPRRLAPKLAMLGMTLKDPDRLAVITDHYVPAHDEASRSIQQLTREWVAAEGVSHYFPEMGICHVVLPEQGLVQPGMLIVGGDSHSPTGGAFGAYMFGVGATDMAAVAATGQTWLKVPRTHLVALQGALHDHVFAKDIILALCGAHGMDMAGYEALEFAGPAVGTMSMRARMTLCNMSAELGAQAGLIAPDAVTAAWLDDRAPHRSRLDGVDDSHWTSDADSHDGTRFNLDLDSLAPQAAAPHSPANAAAITDHESPHFTVAYIGACTGAKLDDLRAAAGMLKGRTVASGTRLLVAPASRADQTQAAEEGVMATLETAGATILPTACGMCAGYGPNRLAADDVCISSTARNFRGRMGAPGSRVWLASPASVAAAAATGRLTDPRDMANSQALNIHNAGGA